MPAGDSLRLQDDDSTLPGLSAPPTSLLSSARRRPARTELTFGRGRTGGATLSVCGSPPPRLPPRGLFFRSCSRAPGLLGSGESASRRLWSERPVAPPRCALGPAACISFSGIRALGKDCAGLGQGAPPDSRAAAPQGFPFLEETGVLSGRAQTAVCAGRREPRPHGEALWLGPVACAAGSSRSQGELLLSRTRSVSGLGLGRDPWDFSVPGPAVGGS